MFIENQPIYIYISLSLTSVVCKFFLNPGELERSSATEDDQNGEDEQSLDSGNEEPVDHPELVDGSGDHELALMNGIEDSRGACTTTEQSIHSMRSSSNAAILDSG